MALRVIALEPSLLANVRECSQGSYSSDLLYRADEEILSTPFLSVPPSLPPTMSLPLLMSSASSVREAGQEEGGFLRVRMNEVFMELG